LVLIFQCQILLSTALSVAGSLWNYLPVVVDVLRLQPMDDQPRPLSFVKGSDARFVKAARCWSRVIANPRCRRRRRGVGCVIAAVNRRPVCRVTRLRGRGIGGFIPSVVVAVSVSGMATPQTGPFFDFRSERVVWSNPQPDTATLAARAPVLVLLRSA
jgi:hypothetical protein